MIYALNFFANIAQTIHKTNKKVKKVKKFMKKSANRAVFYLGNGYFS